MKLTKQIIKKIFDKKFFIPYSDVSKHKVDHIDEPQPGIFIVYIDNVDCPPELFGPLIPEIHSICEGANVKLNKYNYKASLWGFEFNIAKIRLLPIGN